MNLSKFLVITVSMLYGFQAMAGWASGGGKIHKDSMNPWFLENQSQVTYCIDIDEGNFGVTKERAAVIISQAISEWKEAFANADDGYYSEDELEPFDQIRVATQQFVKVECTQEALDLRFQLGHLTPAQQELFDEPREFVGVAFRSDYDKSSLKGHGFIYISPAAGPLKPDHNNLHPDPWGALDNLILKFVLTHELGHVFGVNHVTETLMDESMPELLVNKTFIDEMGRGDGTYLYLKKFLSLKSIFGHREMPSVEACGTRSPVEDVTFFGIETRSDHDCGKVKFAENGKFVVEYKESKDKPYREIATGDIGSGGWRSSPLVSVYLPEEQQVFTKYPGEFDSYSRMLHGEMKVDSSTYNGFIKILATDQTLPFRVSTKPTENETMIVKDLYFHENALYLYK